jgi:hypothetical protein
MSAAGRQKNSRRIVRNRSLKAAVWQRREDRMEDADYFRHKAEQCRRLAGAILNQHDPAVANLLALAVEFEANAVALAAEEASAKQIDQTTPQPK